MIDKIPYYEVIPTANIYKNIWEPIGIEHELHGHINQKTTKRFAKLPLYEIKQYMQLDHQLINNKLYQLEARIKRLESNAT